MLPPRVVFVICAVVSLPVKLAVLLAVTAEKLVEGGLNQ
jgi:hypothetical protein